MRDIQLFIGDKRVELGSSTLIDINDKVQDVKDISKLFTTYSNNFTIPASDKNNLIFKHYYNENITSGSFDARFKVDALIKIDGIDFKKGKIALTSVELHNNLAKNYKVVFYGKTVGFPEIFKKEKLVDLRDTTTLSDLNIVSWGANTFRGLMTNKDDNSFNGDIAIPLISSFSNYFIDSDFIPNTDSPVIENGRMLNYNGSTEDNGILMEDFRPSVKVSKLLEAITERYNIDFLGDFFTSEQFTELYIHCNREEGKLNLRNGSELTEPVRIKSTDYVSGDEVIEASTDKLLFPEILSGRSYFTDSSITIKNIVGLNADETFDIVLTDTVNDKEYYRATFIYSGSGDINFNFSTGAIGYYFQERFLDIQFQTNASFDCDLDLTLRLRTKWNRFQDIHTGLYTKFISVNGGATDLGFVIGEHLPDMKVTTFLTGLFKMFNLVSYIDNNGAIVVDTFKKYYNDGVEYDITRYTDTAKRIVNRANLYSSIEYKFKDNDTIIKKKREQQLSTVYGDLKLNEDSFSEDFAFEGRPLEVELPFSKIVYERLTDQATEFYTDLTYGWGADNTFQPTQQGALLHYIVNTTNNRVGVNDSGTEGSDSVYTLSSGYDASIGFGINLATYNRPSNSNGSYTINFGEEIDEHTLATSQDAGLFNKYHSVFIENLYNPTSRIITITAYLPLHILTQLNLNDTIVLDGNKYLINSLKYNLSDGTGKTNIELISKNFLDSELF